MFGRRMGNSPPPRLSGGIYVYGSYRPSSSPVATKNEFTGRVIRWALELQQYTFNVQYRRGSLNRVADALSRRPHVNAIRPSQCTWYTRQIRKVIERPEDYPEYKIRRGRLFRHILHFTDFKETPSEEQWKEYVPRE